MRLTKHHGLGNDFLIVLDADGSLPVDADLAVRLCQRHTGVGADGLLVARPGGSLADVEMTLFNADGSVAEMSGNGIRCLAQAVVDAGWVPAGSIRIATGAGERVVEVGPELVPGERAVRVNMGPGLWSATEGFDRQLQVSMGNPHTVFLVDSLDDLPYEDASRNVEFVVPGPEMDAITMRVVERGVGETLACGTGACAAAIAAGHWGLVGSTVTVHQRGGDALVEVKDESVFLTGPTVFVAAVEIPPVEVP